MEFIMEAKPRSDNERPTLIDLDVMKEMIEFENFLLNLSLPVPDMTLTNQTEISFYDVCIKEEMVDDIAK